MAVSRCSRWALAVAALSVAVASQAVAQEDDAALDAMLGAFEFSEYQGNNILPEQIPRDDWKRFFVVDTRRVAERIGNRGRDLKPQVVLGQNGDVGGNIPDRALGFAGDDHNLVDRLIHAALCFLGHGGRTGKKSRPETEHRLQLIRHIPARFEWTLLLMTR